MVLWVCKVKASYKLMQTAWNDEMVMFHMYTLLGIPSKLVYRDEDSYFRGGEFFSSLK